MSPKAVEAGLAVSAGATPLPVSVRNGEKNFKMRPHAETEATCGGHGVNDESKFREHFGDCCSTIQFFCPLVFLIFKMMSYARTIPNHSIFATPENNAFIPVLPAFPRRDSLRRGGKKNGQNLKRGPVLRKQGKRLVSRGRRGGTGKILSVKFTFVFLRDELCV